MFPNPRSPRQLRSMPIGLDCLVVERNIEFVVARLGVRVSLQGQRRRDRRRWSCIWWARGDIDHLRRRCGAGERSGSYFSVHL